MGSLLRGGGKERRAKKPRELGEVFARLGRDGQGRGKEAAGGRGGVPPSGTGRAGGGEIRRDTRPRACARTGRAETVSPRPTSSRLRSSGRESLLERAPWRGRSEERRVGK